MSYSVKPALIHSAAVVCVLGLVGCSQPSKPTGTPSASVAPPAAAPASPAVASASAAPAEPFILDVRGNRLTEQEFKVLVLGNTLYRPLENGLETLIYVAPDGTERMRISSVNGQSAADTGKQTLESQLACWQWQKAAGGKRMCFEYFWNGRILTLVEAGGATQPAQFLIRQGQVPGV